jgi:hypothetical protein
VAVPYKNLPILLGSLRQQTASGELVLEQTDGVRRLHFLDGELTQLRSEAAGEQFGSYLLRQGALGLSSLRELLDEDEQNPIGEKVIHLGLMSLEERDGHLQRFQEQIMIHALEYPILRVHWNDGNPSREPGEGLPFKLETRHFIWRTVQEFHDPVDLLNILKTEKKWTWEGEQDLLDKLSDLPLNSGTAYAVSFLTGDPVSFETFLFVSNLDEETAGRFLTTLWAIGLLRLSSGDLPALYESPASRTLESAKDLPFILPPSDWPLGPPKLRGKDVLSDLGTLDSDYQPEFIDLDAETNPDLSTVPLRPSPADLPPSGPRHQSRPMPEPRPDDMPPCGPRPQARPMSIPLQEDVSSGISAARVPPVPSDPPAHIELDSEHRGLALPPAHQALSDAKLLVDRARRQFRLGRSVEAVLTLEQAVQVLPEGDAAYEAWLMLGKLRMANRAWAVRAVEALEHAVRIRAWEAEPWAAMGEIHHRMGVKSKAEACFQRVLELDPSFPIPQDVNLEAFQKAAFPAKPGKKGLFGGRGRKT